MLKYSVMGYVVLKFAYGFINCNYASHMWILTEFKVGPSQQNTKHLA